MDSIAPITAVTAVTDAKPLASNIQVPYGASLSEDIGSFKASLNMAQERNNMAGEGVSELAKAAFKPLDAINQEAQSLGDYAQSAMESGNELTPSEIVSLTVQSQKFMFHSQLVANIANRSADGIQQLFRQQG